VKVPGVSAMEFEPDGEPVGTAVLLPGAGYPPQAPLLFFAGFVLRRHGWRVVHHWWDAPEYESAEQLTAWVCGEGESALASTGATLVIGKSLGTRAAPLVAERGLPAVWLTPLLGDETLVEAMAANPARQLLVGGTADPVWDPPVARRLAEQGCHVVEVPDADHILMTPGDVAAGVEAHAEVVRALDSWLARLPV
jgi:predicted alpha/beta-hydrolase family hydrolase